MEQNYVALQGKAFVVELQSMRGSTGYGWCLSSLPQELILMGIDNIPTAPGIAPVNQKFYFGVVSAQNRNVEIQFVLAAPWKLSEIADTFTARVQIVPSDSCNYVPYSENTNAQTPFFNVNTPFFKENCSANTPFFSNADTANINYKYGYPCSGQNTVVAYGYPYDMQDAVMKYGYPCGMQDPVVKYGYPCGTQNTMELYGYPRTMQEPMVKYGYPCQVAETTLDARPYGYPVMNAPLLKYGYPGCC